MKKQENYEKRTKIMNKQEKPVNQESNRDEQGRFKPGYSGNPLGRPVGKSLKEYWKQRFADMSDEEKEKFSKRVTPELLWQMAEGRPSLRTDITTDGKPLPLLGGKSNDENSDNNSNQKASPLKTEN